MRTPSMLVVLALAAATCVASSDTVVSPELQARIDARNAELVEMHDGLWDLMKLSQSARDELNGIVEGVNVRLMTNQANDPEKFKAAMEVKRRERPPTHEEYIQDHVQRFDKLGITEPTTKELLAAAEFVWSALHGQEGRFTDEERETARIIKEMMTELGGPPPCCDDNIFVRAGD